MADDDREVQRLLVSTNKGSFRAVATDGEFNITGSDGSKRKAKGLYLIKERDYEPGEDIDQYVAFPSESGQPLYDRNPATGKYKERLGTRVQDIQVIVYSRR